MRFRKIFLFVKIYSDTENSRIGGPVGPGLDLGVERVSRALGGRALSVANQLVAGANVSFADTASNQVLSGVHGRVDRFAA